MVSLMFLKISTYLTVVISTNALIAHCEATLKLIKYKLHNNFRCYHSYDKHCGHKKIFLTNLLKPLHSDHVF